MSAMRFVLVVLVVLGLGACSSHEEASSDTGSTSAPLVSLPKYVVVRFQPESSDSQIATFVEDQLMVADPAGGRDFRFPYVGAAFDYPDKEVELMIETNAQVGDVMKAVQNLRGLPLVTIVVASNCEYAKC